MKKIIWFIILVFIIYIVLIFIKPTIANKIATNLGIKNFNEKVLEIKKKLDYISTKVPTKEELTWAYSWAKNKISKIKDKIDNIRNTAEDLENKYENAKEFINETWKKIEKAKETLNNLQEIWSDLQNFIGSWATN